MKKLSGYVLALAVCVGTTSAALVHPVLMHEKTAARQPESEAQLAVDGAYRDGLYLGRLTAGLGQPLRPPIGRWSIDEDRASFAAGYQRGYNDVPGGRATAARRIEE